MTTGPAEVLVVSTEQDPTPLVKIFANKFRKALTDAKFANHARNFHGSFALASLKDPQSLTITVGNGKISITHGIAVNAKIIIRMDFDKPVKPKIEGLFRHPMLALKISKLLQFPETNWTDAASRFWDCNSTYPGMPGSIKIHCADEDRDFILGDLTDGNPDMQISGKGIDIADVFSGGTVFLQALMTGKIKSIASFEHTVVLSDVTVQMLLGER